MNHIQRCPKQVVSPLAEASFWTVLHNTGPYQPGRSPLEMQQQHTTRTRCSQSIPNLTRHLIPGLGRQSEKPQKVGIFFSYFREMPKMMGPLHGLQRFKLCATGVSDLPAHANLINIHLPSLQCYICLLHHLIPGTCRSNQFARFPSGSSTFPATLEIYFKT